MVLIHTNWSGTKTCHCQKSFVIRSHHFFCKSYLRFQQGKFCKKSFKKHLNIFFFNACVRSQEYDEGSLQQIKKTLKCYFNTRPFCAFLCVYRLCLSHELRVLYYWYTWENAISNTIRLISLNVDFNLSIKNKTFPLGRNINWHKMISDSNVALMAL